VKIICCRTIYIAAQPVQGPVAHALQIFQSHRNLYPVFDNVASQQQHSSIESFLRERPVLIKNAIQLRKRLALHVF